MPTLRVVLESPLAASSGFGRPGVVDREVVFDPATGLPYLPGRRLKGLLRDAYRNLFDSLDDSVFRMPEPTQLFGAPGRDAPGLLAIGNARIVADGDRSMDLRTLSSRLRKELSPQNKTQLCSVQDVVRCFTEIRRQTAIDRATGAARRDTLRYTRVLRKGLVFEAALDVPDWALEAISLAAAGVDAMGTSRSRGLGDVRMIVLDDGDDTTPRALARLRSSQPFPNPPPVAALPQSANQNIELASQPPTERLDFRLELTEPALLPRPVSGDPNTAVAMDFIPGTVILGALAAAYRKTRGVDARFRELFCSGKTVFLPATPTQEDESGAWKRSLPVPHSVRESKDHPRRPIDLTEEDDPEPNRRTKRWFDPEAWSSGMPSENFEVKPWIQYHHQRAADARIQRALGNEPADFAPYGLNSGQQGALFVYESLPEGATFEGSILGSTEDLAEVKQLLGESAFVRIGRSRSAQYGGAAKWTWLEQKPLDHNQAGGNRVMLLTPLIVRNKYGHPVADIPDDYFGPNIIKRFTRREFQAGYFSHQNLPREQVPAIAAGSVFVLESEPENGDLALQSYGLRTEEGFGRITMDYPAIPSQELFGSGRKVYPDRTPSPDWSSLAVAIWAARMEDMARTEARRQALAATRIERIRPHVIHRLIRALESPDGWASLSRLLKSLKLTARRQLDRVLVGNLTLLEFLVTAADQRRQVIGEFTQDQGNSWAEFVGTAPRTLLDADPSRVDNLAEIFLIQFLNALARRSKKHEA